MDSETRSYRTGGEEVVLDLTRDAADFVSGRGEGLLHLFVPHATAGLAIIETGAGSDDDLLAALGDLLPADDRWRHRHGSPGHGRSHVMPAVACGTNRFSSPSPSPETNSAQSRVRSRTTSRSPVR